MEAAIEFIHTNVSYAPYIIFGLLLLAGLNIPISEDLMLFTSAMLAAKNPDYLSPLFLAVFLGAFLSDLICYALMGRYLGEKVFKIKAFANMVSPKKIEKVTNFYEKYGMLTLFIGRFIPFGVRNALFITAGLGKMNAIKFAFTDFIACIISCTTFFYLYYTFGETMIAYVKQGNMILFGVFILALSGWLLRKKMKKSPLSPAKDP